MHARCQLKGAVKIGKISGPAFLGEEGIDGSCRFVYYELNSTRNYAEAIDKLKRYLPSQKSHCCNKGEPLNFEK